MFSTLLECSQMSGVFLSQCNTPIKLLLLLYDIGGKNKQVFLAN